MLITGIACKLSEFELQKDNMVNVVQLVERQFVALVVVGSSPIVHPIIMFGSLAQSVEHMTFNHGVPGSIPG